jgi:glycosyltransferase involved in cell wall biosynthesis
MRKKRPDVIFVYAPSPILQAIPGIFLGWLKGVPVVLWVQDLWPESLSATGYIKNKTILKLVEYLVRFIYRHVDLLLVQSQAFIKPVANLAMNTPIKYYPNSVEGSFSVNAIPPNISVDALLHDAFTVIFAGNIGSAQAVGTILEAAELLKSVKDIQIVLLGDGSCRNWMLEEVKSRRLNNLHLPGKYPAQTMPWFMQNASALLVTLANKRIFSATIPNKVQAYLAAGRPIIACLNGEGARLVLDADAGVAVPAEDPDRLAQAIFSLYKMTPNELDILGNNGRNYYEKHFNHEQLMDELIEHFKIACE